MKRDDLYEVPPSIHQYETTFYGMSMGGLLVAAVLLIVGFLFGSTVMGGVIGMILGVIGGLITGLIGLALVTPFASLDDQMPPAYWLKQVQHRHEREIVIEPVTGRRPGVDEAIITDWSGEEIARMR